MPIKQSDLESILRLNFPNAAIKIIDLAGDNNHYSLEIKDDSFAGKSRIEQHKMVNKALKEELKEDLHALQIKTIC